jgi:hypothetical protein
MFHGQGAPVVLSDILSPTRVGSQLGFQYPEPTFNEFARLRRQRLNRLVVPPVPPSLALLTALRERFPAHFDATSFDWYAPFLRSLRPAHERPFSLLFHPETRGLSWASARRHYPQFTERAPSLLDLVWTLLLLRLQQYHLPWLPLYSADSHPYGDPDTELFRQMWVGLTKHGQIQIGVVGQEAPDLQSQESSGYALPAVCSLWRLPESIMLPEQSSH